VPCGNDLTSFYLSMINAVILPPKLHTYLHTYLLTYLLTYVLTYVVLGNIRVIDTALCNALCKWFCSILCVNDFVLLSNVVWKYVILAAVCNYTKGRLCWLYWWSHPFAQCIMATMVHWSRGITKEHGNTIILISTLFCDRLADGKRYKY